jgi:hypothetical protein
VNKIVNIFKVNKRDKNESLSNSLCIFGLGFSLVSILYVCIYTHTHMYIHVHVHVCKLDICY